MDMKISKLENYMTTEVFVVNENDLIDLVTKIMRWKNIHHIPVVNNDNKIIGIISKSNLNVLNLGEDKLLIAKDIMVKNIITVTSDTSIEEAQRIMLQYKVGCLPVLEFGDLIGIITKSDLEKLNILQKKK